jgi:hypothetical protein
LPRGHHTFGRGTGKTRFKVDLSAVTADERRDVLNQCPRVAPPVFGCYAAWFDLAPTEIAFREQLAASVRQQAVPQGPGVPADPPAARTSRLSAGNLGLNSTGTLQGFRHFSGKPTIRELAAGPEVLARIIRETAACRRLCRLAVRNGFAFPSVMLFSSRGCASIRRGGCRRRSLRG